VSSPDKLVYMANQIGKFFACQKGRAAEGIADHVRKFWHPTMRQAILAHLEEGGAGLDPSVREAIAMLKPAQS